MITTQSIRLILGTWIC